MERTVHVAVYDTLADWEIGYAVAQLNDQQWQREPDRFAVATVAHTADPIVTIGGVRIVPDLTSAELVPSRSAMLVLPGARTWDEGGNVEMAEAAREFLAAGVPVAAICGATAGLARAGLLDDRPHTSAAPQYLAATGYAGGAHYVDTDVVDDGSLITAGPTEPLAFARAILARLDVYPPEVLEAWYGLHRTSDPRWFAELMRATGAAPGNG